ncbi:unnamed protein product [Brassicogethes aeneus]|uniref:RING-type E3 ubiquitin transferase n=1 Tax=Brassicogethes aeneus TaxID=1431903 RepID=A0A9P0AX96_BRAAE|nr:unnamed protein product [Brassicogethes aeneus]
MATKTMNQFTDDLLKEKIFHCQICDELCTSDVFLVKGKGNLCENCFEEKCGEEMKSRAELNTALILIMAKLMLPCKYQSSGCGKSLESKKYSKHIATCDFKIKPCPMKNLEGCDWSGSNFEVSGHLLENHQEHVIKSENNIFKVESSLCEPFNVKLLSDDYRNCLLKTSVVDDKFYYALNPVEKSEKNMEYSVEHKRIQTSNHLVLKNVGTLTKLNGFYNEENLDKNPNATVVDINLLKHLADEQNMILNEFDLKPAEIDNNTFKLLECPVCMKTMRPPIYNCTNGHSICIICKELANECPTCKEGWTSSRCYFLENLTTKIKYPCRYNKLGCNEIAIESQLRKHEETCPSHNYQCPMDCSKTGNFEFIVEHLMTEHKNVEFTGEIEDISCDEKLKWMMFDMKFFRISYYSMDFNVYWAVELVCSNENPKLYTYVVKILNHKKALGWTLVKDSTCLKEGPLLQISDYLHYSYRYPMTFNVTIKKNDMATKTMNQFTDDLLKEKIFHCQICDELCTSDVFLVKGKGNVCANCFEEKCGEEMKSRAELNTALILIMAKLMLPCKYQSSGCDKRVESKKYSKHIATCDFKIKPCPMKNLEGCDWSGSNFEVSGHLLENHQEHVIKSENNIFKVESSLCEPFNVKLLSDDYRNCLLKISVVDDKFYYALNPVEKSGRNMEYSVEHKRIQTSNHLVLKSVGTLTKLNGFYNEENLDKNPNATVVDINLLKHLADEQNMILNEFDLKPAEIDNNTLKLLECPVCMNTMRPPIYNCTNGHSICIICKELTNECPTCKEGWTSSRCYFIENLTSKIKYPCKYSKLGCNEIDIDRQLKKHEETCPSHNYQCPMNCSKTGNYEFIEEHLMTEHEDAEFTEEIEYNISCHEKLKWMLFDMNFFRISYYSMHFNVYWAVELVCSNENPKLYTYEVEILNHKRALGWTLVKDSTCLKERTQRPLQPISDCLHYSYRYGMTFNVTIKKSN